MAASPRKFTHAEFVRDQGETMNDSGPCREGVAFSAPPNSPNTTETFASPSTAFACSLWETLIHVHRLTFEPPTGLIVLVPQLTTNNVFLANRIGNTSIFNRYFFVELWGPNFRIAATIIQKFKMLSSSFAQSRATTRWAIPRYDSKIFPFIPYHHYTKNYWGYWMWILAHRLLHVPGFPCGALDVLAFWPIPQYWTPKRSNTAHGCYKLIRIW